LGIDLTELQKKPQQMQPGNGAVNQRQLIEDLLGTILPAFERDLKDAQKNPPDDMPGPPVSRSGFPITVAIMRGMQKYIGYPHPRPFDLRHPQCNRAAFKDDSARAAAMRENEALVGP